MRIKIVYDHPDKALGKFKVKLNKMPVADLDFSETDTIFIENPQLFEDKKNLIQFRVVAPDEAEQKKKNRMENVWRVLLFAVMIVFLPVAFMIFENTKKNFTKIKFSYSTGDDLVLMLTPFQFAWGFESPADESVDADKVFDLSGEIKSE